MTGQFAFVFVESDSGKLNLADRQLVRSRCMQGKNKKSNSRRSLLAAGRATRLPQRNRAPREGNFEYRSKEDDLTPISAGSSSPENLSVNRASATGPPATPKAEAITRFIQQHSRSQLDWELGRFTHEDTQTYPRELLSLNHTFQLVKTKIYPAYGHVYFDDMRNDKTVIQLLTEDAAFRHAVIVTVTAHKERMQQQPFSPDTYRHHSTAVALLNTRVSDEPENLLIDTTIYAIINLAHLAVWLARYDEIAGHVVALKHIIRRRGGQKFLLQRPFMKYQLRCLELVSTMGNGAVSDTYGFGDVPRICKVDAQNDRDSSPPRPPSQNFFPESIVGLVDPKLVSIFTDLQETVHRLNRHWSQYELLQSSAYQPLHGSLMTRLLDLKGLFEDIPSECLRLGLLAFLTITTIRIPNITDRPDKSIIYPYLADSFRAMCRSVESSTPRLDVVVFWLLTVGAMSVFDVDREDWLVQKWNEIIKRLPGVRLTWEEAEMQLGRVLWIARVHSDLGREAYAKLVAKG
ncbi:hypothetical protein GQ53DRAFT_812424 [Thozetella sp. PMI_491]|nr:hypothetical protein GQ53DRAFT_812424 [Thozetella sp. PMI_491]